MRKTLALLMIGSLTLLAGCASPPPPVARHTLPDPPNKFGEPVPLPKPIKGKPVRTFALQNRLGLIEANQRLSNDAAFYDDVRRAEDVR